MVNKSKVKGTNAESAVRDYLRSEGWIYAERLALSGAKDRGDITGVPGVVIEVKAAKELTLGPWLKETEAERVNAGADIAVVWAKRRGFTTPADWFVICEGRVFSKLLHAYTD